MAWAPNDLVTDTDLLAYEREILTRFATSDWKDRRQKALEDWLFPLMEGRGFNPHRFRTRYTAKYVVGTTSSVSTNVTASAATDDGLVLATILAASSDALYVGDDQPFRGLSVRLADFPNATSGALSVAAWADTWEAVPHDNGTKVGQIPFARGGAVTWRLPEAITRRSVNSLGPAYWAKVSMSTAPLTCKVGPISVIRRSRLCAAVAFRTLALIFREAPIAQDGPWEARATWYEREAEAAWLRVADHIGGEFDTDDSDVIDADEADQTADEASSGGWRWERG